MDVLKTGEMKILSIQMPFLTSIQQ